MPLHGHRRDRSRALCRTPRARPAIAALAMAALLAACAPAPRTALAPPADVSAGPGRSGPITGYLGDDGLPGSLALVPAPPAGGAALALDQAVMRSALALQGSARFEQARRDADLAFPQAADLFACALGTRLDPQRTPATLRLLQRSLVDAARSTRAAKDRYRRPRPFLDNGAPTCTPHDEAGLRGSGSYPSGHTAIGWTWALVLSAAAPQRSDALLARGRAFGESRLVCNVHWHSDVVQGRVLGDATFARLQAAPAFQADLAAARVELATAARDAPAQACADEAAALATPLPDAL